MEVINMKFGGITHTITDLEKSRLFYEKAFGFEPGATFEPTRWIVSPLEKTPWGTYRFVIRDPDGQSLAFGQQ